MIKINMPVVMDNEITGETNRYKSKEWFDKKLVEEVTEVIGASNAGDRTSEIFDLMQVCIDELYNNRDLVETANYIHLAKLHHRGWNKVNEFEIKIKEHIVSQEQREEEERVNIFDYLENLVEEYKKQYKGNTKEYWKERREKARVKDSE